MKLRRIKYKNYSIISELKKLNKIDDQFVFLVEGLTLEEIIGIKIELFSRHLNYKLFGFPLWKSVPNMVKDALIKISFKLASNKSEASRMLGVDLKDYKKHLKQFGYELERNLK
tara:strand:- start:240 stop:581 length:342 start_codon:yes stop_codon:yes gene_type:complete